MSMKSIATGVDASPTDMKEGLKGIGAAMTGMGSSTSMTGIRTGILMEAVILFIVSDHANVYISRGSMDTRHSSKYAAAGQVIGKP